MSTGLIGNVRLREQKKDTGRTRGQVLFANQYDSRLTRNSDNYLTPSRIRAIRKDATVQLARQVVVSPMIHTPWEYVAEDDAPTDASKFIEKNFKHERDWLIQNAMFGVLDFGWAPFEVIHHVKEGEVRVKEYKALLQDYTDVLVYINTGRFAGFINYPLDFANQEVIGKVVRTPYALNVNLMYEGTDWYGISVSSILDDIDDDWADTNTSANRFDKKIAGATWVVYYPVGETPMNGVLTDNDVIARTLLSELEASGAIAIPDEIQEFLDDNVERELRGKWRVELVYSQGTQATNFVDRQKYLDNLKIRAFGIPERAILEAKFGTKADAETHSDMALMTIDTKHRLFCDQLNKFVVNPLLRFQYGEEYENSVYIQPAPLVDAQFQTVKEIYRLLVQSPEVINREVANIDVQALRKQVGVPELPGAENDFTYEEPEVPVPFGQNPEQGAGVVPTKEDRETKE